METYPGSAALAHSKAAGSNSVCRKVANRVFVGWSTSSRACQHASRAASKTATRGATILSGLATPCAMPLAALGSTSATPSRNLRQSLHRLLTFALNANLHNVIPEFRFRAVRTSLYCKFEYVSDPYTAIQTEPFTDVCRPLPMSCRSLCRVARCSPYAAQQR